MSPSLPKKLLKLLEMRAITSLPPSLEARRTVRSPAPVASVPKLFAIVLKGITMFFEKANETISTRTVIKISQIAAKDN